MASMEPTASEAATEQDVAPETPAPVDAPAAYVISRELAQATLNYLAAQPYREVFALVQGFETLEPLPTADSDRNGND
jgi:hypothetical protein